MSLNWARARQLLADGDLRSLFIDALGWDHYTTPLDITINGSILTLSALAHKRGIVAYHCPTQGGHRLPDSTQRAKIERQVAKSVYEHLIVFTDAENETQIWYWVKREPGRPAVARSHTYHRSQRGDALLQKLDAIVVTLEEEEALSQIDVTRRTRAAFDVERVTKRFYDRFQKEHTVFLQFITGITGITDRADHEWYASVMLNRLMFVYFIQRKGFLDDDRDYLRNRLKRMRAEHGREKFYSFYRYFLLRLFHEGLGATQRSAELEKLIGHIPYLDGGIFDVHELERPDRYGKFIQIPDDAFEHIFDYFDQYQWHLDERPLRADDEINPDVLGYIFEKYINQKQMGAYYTKEDITEYISKNTVIPFLFDAARAKCKVAFENPKGPTIWDLLKDDPDRYIYKAVRHGITWNYRSGHPNQGEPLHASHVGAGLVPAQSEGQPQGLPLPDDIAVGFNPPTLHQSVCEVASVNDIETIRLRKNWNKAAPPSHALFTETWREVIARRKRYEEVRNKLVAGEVHDINDLITLNLDIRQFAQDVIETCEGPDLLRAFWRAIENVKILDPTCGSGAFLFAALNILDPLYDACLERMEAFVEDLERSGEKHRPEKFSDFRKVLAHVAAHPNRRYFILKSIILNNLFGVDIMEEAVEICKLRLFLKLTAQVDPDTKGKNLGIEPLPDIDFNIRAGNTLVGYATYDEVLKQAEGDWVREQAIESIKIKAADLQQAFDAFRARQIEGDGSVPTEDKQELRRRLNALDDELNRYLATEYGVDPSKKDAYAKWRKSHQPFHWFMEFYGIMSAGGFDVIIGNPPYVEYNKIKASYTVPREFYLTESCGNLLALITERGLAFLAQPGRLGLVLLVSTFTTDRMLPLHALIMKLCDRSWISNFAWRPSKLFDGCNTINAVLLASKKVGDEQYRVFSSKYLKWATEERDDLFPLLAYGDCTEFVIDGAIPKVASKSNSHILRKIHSQRASMHDLFSGSNTRNQLFYFRGMLYWIKVLDHLPVHREDGEDKVSSQCKRMLVRADVPAHSLIAVISSTLFFWFYQTYSDCQQINRREFSGFKFGSHKETLLDLDEQGRRLMEDYKQNSKVIERHIHRRGATVKKEYFAIGKSKSILDEIDAVLARHYGLTEEELDFIINYDIKYRMGRSAEGRDE